MPRGPRLKDVLAIDPSPGLAGGPTTVIFDPEANGKRCVSVNTRMRARCTDYAVRGF